MSEEVRQSNMVDGEKDSKLPAQIIRYEADTFNAAAILQMGQHALSGEPTVVSFIVGGLSKREGVAMNIFGACLRENDGDIEMAVEDAYQAADLILAGSKKYPPGFAAEEENETGLTINNDEVS